MKMTVQQVIDRTLVIAAIIREQRPMPQKGKYRLARMHAKLLPEFNTATAKRDELIRAYDNKQLDADGKPTGEHVVPDGKMPEFNAAWGPIAADVIEVDVEPVPLGYLDLGDKADGSIQAAEIITLGDLIAE